MEQIDMAISGGSRISRRGGVHPLGGLDLQRGHFLVKMYAKMKELGPMGGMRWARPPPPPPRSANGNPTLIHAAFYGHEKCVQLLLKAGASPNTSKGKTALMYAAERGHFKCLAPLVKGGADVNPTTRSSRSAVSSAVENGHHKCVTALLDAGAKVNGTHYTKYGSTLLTKAIEGN